MLYDFQKQCADGKILANGKAPAFIKNLKEKIDKEELAIKNILMEDKDNLDGVIGSSQNDKSYWVERTPIVIYWKWLFH